MKKFISKNIIAAICFLAFSCMLDPRYKTPKTDVPLTSSNNNLRQISNISWEEFFDSPDLQRVILEGLRQNKDLQVAVLNIESARTIHGIIRSDLFPNIDVSASQTRQGVAGPFAPFTPKEIWRAGIGFTDFELDFFGRIRSLKKAALEDYFATVEAKNLLTTTLITEIANAYAQLVLDQQILKLKVEELEILQDKKFAVTRQFEKGLIAEDDFLSSRAEIESKKVELAEYRKIIAQDENALFILVGNFDRENLPKINSLNDIKINEDYIEFAPSENLLSRFDIKQAEHQLKSASADIGAARAAFFPSISLTGSYGYQSLEMNTLFDNRRWSFVPQINLPIFSGGRASANLENSHILKKVEIINYQKAIENAFVEASNKIAEREAVAKQLKSNYKILYNQEALNKNSNAKLKKGLINKIEASDYKLNLVAAKQAALLAQKQYLANLIELYKVLGGGSNLNK